MRLRVFQEEMIGKNWEVGKWEKEIIRGREGCRRGADGDRAAVGRREIYK